MNHHDVPSPPAKSTRRASEKRRTSVMLSLNALTRSRTFEDVRNTFTVKKNFTIDPDSINKQCWDWFMAVKLCELARLSKADFDICITFPNHRQILMDFASREAEMYAAENEETRKAPMDTSRAMVAPGTPEKRSGTEEWTPAESMAMARRMSMELISGSKLGGKNTGQDRVKRLSWGTMRVEGNRKDEHMPSTQPPIPEESDDIEMTAVKVVSNASTEGNTDAIVEGNEQDSLEAGRRSGTRRRRSSLSAAGLSEGSPEPGERTALSVEDRLARTETEMRQMHEKLNMILQMVFGESTEVRA